MASGSMSEIIQETKRLIRLKHYSYSTERTYPQLYSGKRSRKSRRYRPRETRAETARCLFGGRGQTIIGLYERQGFAHRRAALRCGAATDGTRPSESQGYRYGFKYFNRAKRQRR